MVAGFFMIFLLIKKFWLILFEGLNVSMIIEFINIYFSGPGLYRLESQKYRIKYPCFKRNLRKEAFYLYNYIKKSGILKIQLPETDPNSY